MDEITKVNNITEVEIGSEVKRSFLSTLCQLLSTERFPMCAMV